MLTVVPIYVSFLLQKISSEIKNNSFITPERKSVELLAYLIYKNGTGVNSQELINVLFGDNATSSASIRS